MSGITDLRLEVIQKCYVDLDKAGGPVKGRSPEECGGPEENGSLKSIVVGSIPGGEVRFSVRTKGDAADSYVESYTMCHGKRGSGLDYSCKRRDEIRADAATADVREMFPKVVQALRDGFSQEIKKFGSLETLWTRRSGEGFIIERSDSTGHWGFLRCFGSSVYGYVDFHYTGEDCYGSGSGCDIGLWGSMGVLWWLSGPAVLMADELRKVCEAERGKFPSSLAANP